MMAKEIMENNIPKEEIAEENGRDCSFFFFYGTMVRVLGPWLVELWQTKTDRKTRLRVYRNTILDLEKRRRKMGIRRRRRRKKGTREEGSKQEAAEKKKDSELVWTLRRRVGTRTRREREAVSEGGGERGSRSHRHLFGVATVAKSARGHTRNPKWKKAMLRRWDPLFLSLLLCLFFFFPLLLFLFFFVPSYSLFLRRSPRPTRLGQLHCTPWLQQFLEYCAHLRGMYVSRNERCVFSNRKRREEKRSFTAFKRRKAHTSSWNKSDASSLGLFCSQLQEENKLSHRVESPLWSSEKSGRILL